VCIGILSLVFLFLVGWLLSWWDEGLLRGGGNSNLGSTTMYQEVDYSSQDAYNVYDFLRGQDPRHEAGWGWTSL